MKNQLKPIARRLRKDQTHAEKLLWDVLRGRHFQGCKFRRQFPIGGYIADFVCLERKLVIELDGPHHDRQTERDIQRDILIESKGFVVVRYKNDQLFNNFEWVLSDLEFYLKSSAETPHPNPLPVGEGIHKGSYV